MLLSSVPRPMSLCGDEKSSTVRDCTIMCGLLPDLSFVPNKMGAGSGAGYETSLYKVRACFFVYT